MGGPDRLLELILQKHVLGASLKGAVSLKGGRFKYPSSENKIGSIQVKAGETVALVATESPECQRRSTARRPSIRPQACAVSPTASTSPLILWRCATASASSRAAPILFDTSIAVYISRGKPSGDPRRR